MRGNMFAGTANPYDGHWSKHREGDFQDLDQWLNTIEAPAYVGPPIDTQLAEEGAILFHTKDLWADPGNEGIPRPPGGNGSCSGCHGAYSPRYIHQPGFLTDPRLGGMSGYIVPLAIVGTDPATSDGFNDIFPLSGRQIPSSLGSAPWMSYPDANAGYIVPELAGSATPTFSSQPDPDRVCGLGTLGGYVAQSLHGAWASAPYFHNGSVPTVWDVLKPLRSPVALAAPAGASERSGERLSRFSTRTSVEPTTTCTSAGTTKRSRAIRALRRRITRLARSVRTSPYRPDPNAVDDRTIFNTNDYGKGNQGHEYTQVLTDAERLTPSSNT